MIDLSRLKERWEGFANSTRGKRIINGVRGLLVAGIVGYLIYRLSLIGWGELWTSLPQTPYFYVTVLLMYSILPVSESLIYGMAWDVKPWASLPVLLRKRVLNADVLGYSGEAYLFAYARKNVDKPARTIALVIKDNLILSGFISVASAIVLLIGLLLSGYVALEAILGNPAPGYIGGAAFALVLAVGLFVQFRGSIFHLGEGLLARIAGLHVTRFLLSYVLQVVQWWVVLPDAPFSAWATLLVVLTVMNRIPFLPSRDLIFAGAGIELSTVLGIPVAPVAGMLLVRSAIDRILNFGFFTATTAWEQRYGASIESEDVAAFERVDDEGATSGALHDASDAAAPSSGGASERRRQSWEAAEQGDQRAGVETGDHEEQQ